MIGRDDKFDEKIIPQEWSFPCAEERRRIVHIITEKSKASSTMDCLTHQKKLIMAIVHLKKTVLGIRLHCRVLNGI